MNTNEANGQFESVSGLQLGQILFVDAGRLAKEGTTGVVAEGTYEGSQMRDTKFGSKPVYKIRKANGDLYHITAAGNLKFRMEQATNKGLVIGTPIQVSYLGQTPMSSGPFKGTKAHSFDVAIIIDGREVA